MGNFIIYTHHQIALGGSNQKIRLAEQMARMGKERKVYKVLTGNSEGKRPLGRPRRRGEDGIKKVLREIGWGCGLY
jgi:hypothetical protein